MRVEKREFVWEFSQLSRPGQTRKELHESWEARVCVRVFSTLMSWSNKNKSGTRIDESWQERVCMRVSQLSCLGQARTWVAQELIELKSESLYESFLNSHACPGQMRMRVVFSEFWTNLLGINVNTRKPATKARVRMVPTNHHFWSTSLPKHVQHLSLKNRIHSFNTYTLYAEAKMHQNYINSHCTALSCSTK